MDEIRCGEPDCPEMASTESIVEMANLTGGALAGIFPASREYRCPSGHITSIRTEFDRLKASLHGWSKDRGTEAGSDADPKSTAS